MAAEDHLQGAQFHYFAPGEEDPKSLYVNEHHKVAVTIPAPFDVGQGRNHITPQGAPIRAGEMTWKRKGGTILRVEVPSLFQRRGIATALHSEAQRIASENPRIPQPKHSNDRTKEGDAWARAVGGRLPHRKKFE
jgi:hypothetical protein